MRHLILALLLLCPLAEAQGQKKPEATLQGRPLREWLLESQSGMWVAAESVLYDFSRTAPNAVPALVAALGDAEPKVRRGAARALISCGPQTVQAVPALLKVLATDRSADVRISVVDTLSSLIPRGMQVFPHEEDFYDPSAGLLLAWKFGIVLPALLHTMERDPDTDVRSRAAAGLDTMQPLPRIALPAVLRACKDRSMAVRGEAAWALAKLGEPPVVVPLLLAMFEDAAADDAPLAFSGPSWSTFEKIAAALGNIRPAIPRLLKALTDPSPRIRAGAVLALSHFGYSVSEEARTVGRTLIPEVTKLLSDPETVVRLRASRCLLCWSWAADRAVIPALARCCGDPDEGTRFNALIALSAVARRERDAFAALVTLARDGPARARVGAVHALGEQREHAAQVVPVLVPLLADANKDLAGAAAYGLSLLGPDAKDAVPWLILAWWTGDRKMKEQTAWALQKIDPGAAKRMGVR